MRRILPLRILSLAGVFITLAFSAWPAFGWSSPGHLLIAGEAFRELSPEMQAQVFEVLKAHPDFQRWTASYHPNPNVSLAAYVFMRSSTWPDDIRRSGSPYDHPNWHFIDYPLRPPGFAFEPDARPTDDVLYGVAQCERTLGDTNADPELRAVYLSYLVHLIGDMHQPLHCESFYGSAYPEGDRGGNDFYVKPAGAGVRLHGIWDGLLGNSVNPRTQWNYGLTLEAKYPRSALPELANHTTPKDWSLESRQLAIDYGYLHGGLKSALDADSAQPLPADYLKAAKGVAEKQGALAGYRLADDINQYLKLGHPVPLLPANTSAANEALPEKIGTAQASQYYNETMVVTGRVVQVSLHATIAILDLDQPYPSTPCTAVVFSDDFGKFGDLHQYKGKDVEIHGDITDYHGKPEIILDSGDQIKVVGQ